MIYDTSKLKPAKGSQKNMQQFSNHSMMLNDRVFAGFNGNKEKLLTPCFESMLLLFIAHTTGTQNVHTTPFCSKKMNTFCNASINDRDRWQALVNVVMNLWVP
jgi:hypothetical protein